MLFCTIPLLAAPGEEPAKPAPKPPRLLVQPGPGRVIGVQGGRSKRVDYAAAEILLVGKVDLVQYGPVASSFPPIYSLTLTVTPTEVIRGDFAVGKQAVFGYSKRTTEKPVFAKGQRVLVVAAKLRGTVRATSIEDVDADKLSMVKLAGSLPIGWEIKDGQAVSPWASLGKEAFPLVDAGKTELRCASTGRPAWLAGSGLKVSVKPVPPKKAIKWTNPDGDGAFTITVTNTTKKPITSPALLHDASKKDKPLLWSHSLLILCQGKSRLLPGTTPLPASAKPTATTLKPGQSVSTVINVLPLKQINWPRGGYRISFQFAMGEHSATQSMYYMSRHHDKLRKAASE